MTQTETATPTVTIPKTNSMKSTDAALQRQRILERLRESPATTIELRGELDVMMPAARIFELRHDFGFEIDKTMVQDETKPDHEHTVALYSLVREGIHADA